MATTDPPFLVVGHLSKAHGTKGELFVWPLTDSPDTTFAAGVQLWLADDEGTRPAPYEDALTVAEARPHQRGLLVRFAEVEDRSVAERLRGRYLLRPFDEAEPLDEGEVFYHQLLGLEVRTVDGRTVGKVVEVYELPAADLLEVKGMDRTVLVPFTKQVVKETRPEEGVLIVDPPEGLLDL